MTNITEHYLQQFFKAIMMDLRLYGWTLNICSDCYCWQNRKRIDVDRNYDGDIRQIILHEIAHISTAKYSNQKHTPEFWKHLEYLCWKYLRQGLDDCQLRHRVFMGKGICSIIYYDTPSENPYIKKFFGNFSTDKVLAK
jgi:hypothetical protein